MSLSTTAPRRAGGRRRRTRYAVNAYRATKVPSPYGLHLMNRLGCGFSTRTWERMRAAGGPSAWFEQQLSPETVSEHPKVGYLDRWFPELFETPAVKFTKSKVGYGYADQLSSWTMLRRIHSNRQVLETMVDFWSNHLHVTAVGGTAWVQRFHYDQTVRRHALGRFEDLLVACTLHPAMLLYLDNFRSVKGAPNENHGRELLELHTVGRQSGYTEQMVKDSAVILSGYRVDFRGTWEMRYNPRQHTEGPVNVLGFSHPNSAADGSALTVDYLRFLARHPATARTIAAKLVTRFVGDYPSAALVDRLAQVYLAAGTDIRPVLRALVASPEFQGSAGQKVRTPVDDLVATARALRVRATRPTGGRAFAHRITHQHRGLPLYQWPRPDGAPERSADWASAARMLSSFRMHWDLASGTFPQRDVRYRKPQRWLPRKSIRLDRYVDHLSRSLLGRRSSRRMVKAVCQATGYRPDEKINRRHELARGQFVRVAAVLLDSPQHMSR
jgi:hypothetical protein